MKRVIVTGKAGKHWESLETLSKTFTQNNGQQINRVHFIDCLQFKHLFHTGRFDTPSNVRHFWRTLYAILITQLRDTKKKLGSEMPARYPE